jgi:hypothetical protein
MVVLFFRSRPTQKVETRLADSSSKRRRAQMRQGIVDYGRFFEVAPPESADLVTKYSHDGHGSERVP